MSIHGRLAEIPGTRFLGRPIRPMHLMFAVGTAALGTLQYINTTPLSASSWGDYLGFVAFVSAALLTVGWWARSDRLAEYGLLLAAGVWAERTIAVLLTESSTTGAVWLSAQLSIAWCIGAAGAYWLERAEHHLSGGPVIRE